MEIKNVLIKVSAKKRREWKVFFSNRGTQTLVNKETGVGRTTLWRLLNGTTTQIEADVVLRIDNFIKQYKKEVSNV